MSDYILSSSGVRKFGIILFFCTLYIGVSAQLELRVVVNSGNATTTCRDFLSQPNAHWGVLVDAVEWVTYPATAFCFQSLPHVQYSRSIDCKANAPDFIQVCFRAFDKEGSGCALDMDCREEICEFFEVPDVGEVIDYTLALPAGRSSGGSVNFSVGLIGVPVQPDHDFICDAVDFGVVPLGEKVGDASVGDQSNYCATNEGDPNPFEYGSWANDRGVWYKFTTSDNPGSSISLVGVSDPENTGDNVALQFAVYTTLSGDCTDDLIFVDQSYDWRQLDETMVLECPEPNTSYYLLVDGPEGSERVEGPFGLEIVDDGVSQGHEVIDTVLCFGESLKVSNNTYTQSGNYTDIISELGKCDRIVESNITVLPELTAFAEEVAPVSFEGLADGQAQVSANGGDGNYTYLWSNGSTGSNPNNFEAGIHCVTVTDGNNCQVEACVTIETDLFPIKVSLQNDELDCHGDQNGQLVISLLGGEPPYQIDWNSQDESLNGSLIILNEEEVNTIPNLMAGSYVLNISDDADLSTTVFAQVTQPEQIMTLLEESICDGEELRVGETFYESEGSIYEILTAVNGCDSIVAGQLTILPIIENELEVVRCAGETFTYENQTYSSSTDIFETYQASSGCDSNVVVHLTILEELQVELEQYQLASGFAQQDASVRAVVTGGDGDYQLDWSDGQQGSTPINMMGGNTYCVKVKDGNNCMVEDCIDIEYSAENIVALQSDTLQCAGVADGTLQIIAGMGAPPYTFSWKKMDGTLSGNGAMGTDENFVLIENLSAGVYEIEVADANVSTKKTAQIIDVAPLEITVLQKEEISCQGFCDGLIQIEASGGTAPYTYQWGNDMGNNNTITSLCPDQYNLRIIDANGCETSQQFEITEPLVPLSANVSILSEPSCHGESDGRALVEVQGANNTYAVQWSNGSNNELAESLSAGTYYLTVTNGAACSVIDSVLITEPGVLDFELMGMDPTCTDGQNSGQIEVVNRVGGTGPFYYAVDERPFQSLPNFGQLTAGSHRVQIEDSNGCTLEKTIELYEPNYPIFDLTQKPETELGQPLDIRLAGNIDGLKLKWMIGDSIACSDCTTLNIMPLQSTDLQIIGIDKISGCQTVINTEIRVIKKRDVFIPTAFSPNDDGINDLFHIYGGASISQIIDFKVFDRHGALVHQAANFQPETESAAWNGRFRNREMNQGVYVYWAELEFIDGERVIVKGDVSLLR